MRILRSSRFFYASLVVFVAQAGWVALSGLYPMAYDEATHFSVIKLYALYSRWSPFWASQPPGTQILGPLPHDTSFLYRFLLSFPYRIMDHFGASQMTQILVFRGISIALFVVGLILFRKLLLKVGASKAMANVVMAVVMLTPVVVLLAAQINYDNLLFPLVAITGLLLVRFVEKAKQGISDAQTVLALMVVGLLASLVTYAFLPILLVAALWVLGYMVQQVRHSGFAAMWQGYWRSFRHIAAWRQGLLLVGVVVSLGLFGLSYGVNLWQFKEPVPSCNQVLSKADCSFYGPWRRDNLAHADLLTGKLVPAYRDPLNYTIRDWSWGMGFQFMSTLNGESSQFTIGQPLPLARGLEWVVGVIGVALVLRWQKYLRRNWSLVVLVSLMLGYVAALWFQEYTAFLYAGFPAAVQARYLVMILPIFYLLLALAYGRTLRAKPELKVVLVWLVLAILLFEGGGALPFIMRSDTSWYWPNHLVQSANHMAQKALHWLVIGA